MGNRLISKVNPNTKMKNKLERHDSITLSGSKRYFRYNYILHILYKLEIAIIATATTRDILLIMFPISDIYDAMKEPQNRFHCQ